LHFKAEHLQRAGAFKFRGACNAVWSLSDEEAARGVLTHSSGNHGAALALAARTRGIAAHVVVPRGAVPAKLAAIRAYGATLHECEPNMTAREAMVAKLQAETGARLVHPFTDPLVIAGQGTAVMELLAQSGGLDAVITPLGGGGLIGGTATAVSGLGVATRVFGAEPAGASEAHDSLVRGERITEHPAETVCDGLRATFGEINFAMLRRYGVEVLTVPDEETLAAMRLLWQRMKLLVEPSSAIAFAALLRNRERFAGQRVGVLLSGGNVDLDALMPA
jgi:threonine dehydratase